MTIPYSDVQKCMTLHDFMETREEKKFSTGSPHYPVDNSSSRVSTTSKDSYREVVASGDAACRVEEYLRVLRTHPFGLTDRQAATLLGWDCSTVSARRNDVSSFLGRHAVVHVPGDLRKNVTGKNAKVWRYKN